LSGDLEGDPNQDSGLENEHKNSKQAEETPHKLQIQKIESDLEEPIKEMFPGEERSPKIKIKYP
jgi:hypothetical protein